MPLLAPLVDWAKVARAVVGTRGYAGSDGLGCTDLTAHPDTKVAIPLGTTIARIRLTRPLLAADKPKSSTYRKVVHYVSKAKPKSFNVN